MHFRLLSFLLLLVSVWPAVASERWWFLPNYRHDIRGVEKPSANEEPFFESLPKEAEHLTHEESGLTEAQRQELFWHGARFPHRDFVNLMPGQNVFGWYVCDFDIPAHLFGLDVIVDLGIIDDTDECFVNGTRVGGIGQLGQPHATAWQTDRLYRVHKDLLAPLDNHLAVHVWSLWGLGGIVGPPVLKATPVKPDAQWEIAFVRYSSVPTGGLNKAQSLTEALSCFPEGDCLVWQRHPQPWKGYASWDEDAHYALFRIRLDFPQEYGSFSIPVVLDAGPVFDIAAFYLNGKRLGLVGRFPEGEEPPFTEAARRARFLVNPEDWAKDGQNELVAVVLRERGVGGLPGIPGILLANPLTARHPDFDEIQEGFDILVQSGHLDDAEALLAKARPISQTERAWLLSHKAHLAFLRWHDSKVWRNRFLDGVLAPVAEILAKYPSEAPRQSAMQAFCRILRLAEKDAMVLSMVHRQFPLFNTACRILLPDRRTLGDWPMAYGNRQFVLAGFGKVTDLHDSEGPAISFHIKTGDKDDPARRWQPTNARFTDAHNALVMPASQFPQLWKDSRQAAEYAEKGYLFPNQKIRRAAWWDDHGEMHPFDDEGPNLHIAMDASIESGQLLSFYLCDFDWKHTLHPRQQSFLVLNEEGRLLNALWSGKSDSGVYERLVFIVPCSPKVIVAKHRGACVAVSGVFLDYPTDSSNDKGGMLWESTSERVLAAWRIAMDAGRELSIHTALDRYLSILQEISDDEEILFLLNAFKDLQNIHPLWHYAAIGRLATLQIPPQTHRPSPLGIKTLEERISKFPIPLLDVLVDALQRQGTTFQ